MINNFVNMYDEVYFEESHIIELQQLARPERWENRHSNLSFKFPILRNYLNQTLKRLVTLHHEDNKGNFIYNHNSFLCFNTGLYTKNYEEIYGIMRRNDPKYRQKYRLDGFFQPSSPQLREVRMLPSRAYYFNDISEIYYNTKYDLRINIDHILDDETNKERIPEEYREDKMLAFRFKDMAIKYAKLRIEENYKTAVPQFYGGRVQFLIPISLGDPDVVDLALVVNREKSIYTGRTCLTLDMAYNNARLIAKPESDWL